MGISTLRRLVTRSLSPFRVLAACALLLVLLPAGCTPPNQENIRLRKLNQDLQGQVDRLTTENQAAQQKIAGLSEFVPIVPQLPPDELKKLWVTGGLRFGPFSGGIDLDGGKPGDEGFRAYLSPIDQSGSPIQAAGSFVIEAFDLAEPGDNRLGHWTWDVVDAKAQWRQFLMEFDYVLTCPWQKTPKHADITVRATFTDQLTHNWYIAETVMHVKVPPPAVTTAPATKSSNASKSPSTLPK